MDRFIELTSVRHDRKIVLNVNRIAMIMPSNIGCEIVLDTDTWKPFAVTESYEELKKVLVTRYERGR